MNKNEKCIPIDVCIVEHLSTYFDELGDMEAYGVYDMVMNKIEKPMLEFILEKYKGNQTHAAKVLGLNRNTLRKKMIEYKLIK